MATKEQATPRSEGKAGHGGTRRGATRRPSATMTANMFALSTLATMVVLGCLVRFLCPLPLGIRLFPGIPLPDALASGDATSMPCLVASGVLLYASARLTRNATLESDRVRSDVLRRIWVALFEILWVILFVVVGESFAMCVDAHVGDRFGSHVGGVASWGVLSAAVLLRCLLARHDHHVRHVACEALRSVGRSGILCVAWVTASVLILPYGVIDRRVLLVAVVVASVAEVVAIARACLAEGRHREGHGR